MHYATAISINELQGSYTDTVPRNRLPGDALLWISLGSYMEQRGPLYFGPLLDTWIQTQARVMSSALDFKSKKKKKAASGIKFGFWLGIMSNACEFDIQPDIRIEGTS